MSELLFVPGPDHPLKYEATFDGLKELTNEINQEFNEFHDKITESFEPMNDAQLLIHLIDISKFFVRLRFFQTQFEAFQTIPVNLDMLTPQARESVNWVVFGIKTILSKSFVDTDSLNFADMASHISDLKEDLEVNIPYVQSLKGNN